MTEQKKFQQTEADKGKISKYNEAALKMERIHKLQERIHLANLNPLAVFVDKDIGWEGRIYGYEIVFNCLRELFAEVHSKLDVVTRDRTHSFINDIRDFMYKNPIWKVHPNGQKRLIRENWNTLQDSLYNLDLILKGHLEKTKMGAPDDDRPELSAYG